MRKFRKKKSLKLIHLQKLNLKTKRMKSLITLVSAKIRLSNLEKIKIFR